MMIHGDEKLLKAVIIDEDGWHYNITVKWFTHKFCLL